MEQEIVHIRRLTEEEECPCGRNMN